MSGNNAEKQAADHEGLCTGSGSVGCVLKAVGSWKSSCTGQFGGWLGGDENGRGGRRSWRGVAGKIQVEDATAGSDGLRGQRWRSEVRGRGVRENEVWHPGSGQGQLRAGIPPNQNPWPRSHVLWG